MGKPHFCRYCEAPTTHRSRKLGGYYCPECETVCLREEEIAIEDAIENARCRDCGIKFGEDGRSFRFVRGKKPICFNCDMKSVSKETLITALSILASK